ncbi:MAG: hypothetical protein Q4G09_04660 [Clostridia bacterium]|nr:hypothetical protein [Clostridia bacterium]
MENIILNKLSEVLKEVKKVNKNVKKINEEITQINEKIDILYSSDILSKKILNNHEHRIYNLEKQNNEE